MRTRCEMLLLESREELQHFTTLATRTTPQSGDPPPPWSLVQPSVVQQLDQGGQLQA